MKRRAVLSGLLVAGVGSLSGCAEVFEQKPLRVRAMPANGGETDVRCELPVAVVEDHPALHDVLRMTAAEREDGSSGWVGRDVTRKRGEAIRQALDRACEETGGLYRWKGSWYFVSILVK